MSANWKTWKNVSLIWAWFDLKGFIYIEGHIDIVVIDEGVNNKV